MSTDTLASWSSILLYVHRDGQLGTGSPGRPPRLSHAGTAPELWRLKLSLLNLWPTSLTHIFDPQYEQYFGGASYTISCAASRVWFSSVCPDARSVMCHIILSRLWGSVVHRRLTSHNWPMIHQFKAVGCCLWCNWWIKFILSDSTIVSLSPATALLSLQKLFMCTLSCIFDLRN